MYCDMLFSLHKCIPDDIREDDHRYQDVYDAFADRYDLLTTDEDD